MTNAGFLAYALALGVAAAHSPQLGGEGAEPVRRAALELRDAEGWLAQRAPRTELPVD